MKKDVWSYLKEINIPIIIYGMGNGADKIINEFNKLEINFTEIIASDDFVRGQYYKGYKVKTLDEIKNTYNNFIIVLAFATQIDSVINHIYEIEKKYKLVAPFTPVYGEEIFNYEYYIKNKNDIMLARSLMADEKSLQVFDNYINYMLYGKLDYIKECQTNKDEIFNNVLKLSSNEHYADLGAYKGDTIDELLNYCNGYNSIYAFEPDKKTYEKLLNHTKNFPQTYTYNCGLWEENSILKFDFNAGRNSTLSSNSNNYVKVVALDSILKNKKLTYIKFDIEGAELKAINGAKNILKTQKPKLNIALYHKCEDIFKIPLLIKSINKDYKFYLRHHPYIPFWDTNLYCI